MNPEIDTYLEEGCGRCPLGGTPQCKVHGWTKELNLLRSILLECGLTEELKWGAPCYTYRKNNIAMMSALKESAVLSFFKGTLLQDAENLLVKPGENTQSARMFKFTDAKEIEKLSDTIKAYVFEAIEVEKAGLKPDFKAKNELEYPAELLEAFDRRPDLKTAFESLTPGKQRGYILFFTQPKQSETRTSRIEKKTDQILDGKGMHDDYKSKR